MTLENGPLYLLGPEVLEISAASHPVAESHLNWTVGFAPEWDAENGGRVVFGTIHAAGGSGSAEVTVACVIGYDEAREPGTEKFGEVLRPSSALETLWDVARVAFAPIAAVIGVVVEIPRKAPDPLISTLVRASTSSPDSEGADDEEAKPEQ